LAGSPVAPGVVAALTDFAGTVTRRAF